MRSRRRGSKPAAAGSTFAGAVDRFAAVLPRFAAPDFRAVTRAGDARRLRIWLAMVLHLRGREDANRLPRTHHVLEVLVVKLFFGFFRNIGERSLETPDRIVGTFRMRIVARKQE